MAIAQLNLRSDVLGLAVTVRLVLPQPMPGADTGADVPQAPPHGWPVLYLLHGLSDDETGWSRYTGLERYAKGRGLVVVMPSVGRSFYTDMASGLDYWTYLSEELPQTLRGWLNLSTRRQDTFAAGLSMGGYGAFKLALTHPDRFAGAASMSGALDLATACRTETRPPYDREFDWIFGDRHAVGGGPNDLLALAEKLAARDRPRPALYQTCGDADFLFENNLQFRDHLRNLGGGRTWPFEYHEHPGEGHSWSYWDRMLPGVFNWIDRVRTQGPALSQHGSASHGP